MSRRSNDQTVFGMNWKLMTLIGVSLVILVGGTIAGIHYTGEITRIGGSIWQFDYEFTQLAIEGAGRATPNGFAPAIDKTYTSGQTPYHWSYDIDGDYTDSTDPERTGHFPTISTGVSMVGRVDKDGNFIDKDAEDPNQQSYVIGSQTYYQFYYMFDYSLETSQKQNVGGMEWGYMDVYTTITIILSQSVFNRTVDAFFGDARVHNVSWVPDPLVNDDVTYFFPPQLDIHHDPGNAISIDNDTIDAVNHFYTGDLTLHTGLEPGVTTIGVDIFGSWNIKIVYSIMVCLLLIYPLEVGDPSHVKPFNYNPPTPWWLDLLYMIAAWMAIYGPWLIVAVVLIVILMCCVRGGINIQKVSG